MVQLGHKADHKKVDRCIAGVTGALGPGETLDLLLAGDGRGMPSVAVTSERVLSVDRDSGQILYSLAFADAVKMTLHEGRLTFLTGSGAIAELGTLAGGDADGRLLVAQVGDRVVLDPPCLREFASHYSGLELLPSLKDKHREQVLAGVAPRLLVGEQPILAANAEGYRAWLIATDRRLLLVRNDHVASGATSMPLGDITSVHTERPAFNEFELVVGLADGTMSVVGLGAQSEVGPAFEEALARVAPVQLDTWPNEVADAMTAAGLRAFVGDVTAGLVPGITEPTAEQVLGICGVSQQSVIFTQYRACFVSGSVVARVREVDRIEFSVVQTRTIDSRGGLEGVGYTFRLHCRLIDGRRYDCPTYLGTSTKDVNEQMPALMGLMRVLADAGYPVYEGPDTIRDVAGTQLPRMGFGFGVFHG